MCHNKKGPYQNLNLAHAVRTWGPNFAKANSMSSTSTSHNIRRRSLSGFTDSRQRTGSTHACINLLSFRVRAVVGTSSTFGSQATLLLVHVNCYFKAGNRSNERLRFSLLSHRVHVVVSMSSTFGSHTTSILVHVDCFFKAANRNNKTPAFLSPLTSCPCRSRTRTVATPWTGTRSEACPSRTPCWR